MFSLAQTRVRLRDFNKVYIVARSNHAISYEAQWIVPFSSVLCVSRKRGIFVTPYSIFCLLNTYEL